MLLAEPFHLLRIGIPPTNDSLLPGLERDAGASECGDGGV